jgi:hypothetical protein
MIARRASDTGPDHTDEVIESLDPSGTVVVVERRGPNLPHLPASWSSTNRAA